VGVLSFQEMLENRTMPACTVIPELVYEDVGEAIEWLSAAFGFRERWRAGGHRAQLQVGEGGGAVVLTEARTGQRWRDQPDVTELRVPRAEEFSSAVLVRVEDVDLHHSRARECGARILNGPNDYPYGERQYSAMDLAGHRWCFTQSIADLVPEEWGGASAELG
jgi:uncharacterized glyoxalase superfamily protein PhnB